MDKNIIYLDNAATTFVAPEVVDVVSDALKNLPFNPSSVYMPSVEVYNVMEKARLTLLSILGLEDGNLIFTGSATEANNTALLKIKARNSFTALIGSTEHPAVYEMAEKLKAAGADIKYIPVDSFGRIKEDEYIELLENNPVRFVSIMHVNNENGVINDIARLCAIAKEKDKRIIFHSDGVQAFGKFYYNLDEMGVDMYTICSHKINGPKGIGALCFKKNISIEPLIVGGGQENNLRSGTENLPYICGFVKAAQLKVSDNARKYKDVQMLKYEFLHCLKARNIDFELYSDDTNSVPHIILIRFKGVRGEVLLHALEKYKIYISTGSACSSKKKTNRVLDAMGKSFEESQEVVRISFGNDNYDVNYIADCFANEIKNLKVR